MIAIYYHNIHGFTYVELKGDWGNLIVLCCCPQIYSCTYISKSVTVISSTTIPQWSLQIYHFELNVPPVVALDAYSSASHLTCVCYDVIRWFLAKSYQGTCVWSGRQRHPFNVWWFGFTHASDLQSIVRISLMYSWYSIKVSLSVCELVKTCSDVVKSTAQDRATREKGPATELKLGTYTCSIAEQPHESPIPVKILRPQSPCSTSHRCATIQWPLQTRASRLVPRVVWW